MNRNLVFAFLLAAASLSAQAPAAPAAAAVPAPQPAQASPAAVPGYAEIVYLQGSDLMVLRKDLPVSLPEPIGARLLPGDVLQTGPKTQAEILLRPRGARLRLSENTVLTIRELSDQTTSLELQYGRLRSKVEKLTARGNPFELRASGVVAGVRGTDFGCDNVAARPGAKALVVVYCFEGSIEVSAPEKAEAGAAEAEKGPEPVFLDAGAMATIETGPAAAAIETGPIVKEIRDFWKDRDFSSAGAPAAALPEGGPGGETAAKAAQPSGAAPGFTAADLGSWKKGVARKNSIAVATIGFVAAGAAMQGAAIYLRNSNATAANALAFAGALCSAVGIPVLILSISIDPFAPAK